MGLRLEQLGWKVWYDNDADNLTKLGMLKGVRGSVILLLFLSKGVLAREVVQLEVREAIAHGRPILLVHEDDDLRPGYARFKDMIKETPDDLKHLFEDIQSIAFRRLRHERVAFYGELSRRIKQVVDALPPA